jgi:multiple sugar transport system permease protein
VQTLMGAARNTVFYTIVVNIGTIGVGLLAALLLNRRFRGQKIARTLLLLPWIVPTYAVGMVWGAMWLRETGFVNQLLVGFGIVTEETRPFWLIGPNAFWAVVIPTIWRSLPFNIVMMLAGLQVIPEELFEAASMDGASAFQKLRFITLPLLRPVLSIMLLWGLIFTAFGYNIVVMMFGNGGGFPGEHADLLMPALSRQTFNKLNFGTGAAMSVMMMTVMMIVISGWLRAFRSTFSPEQVGV